MRVGFWNRYDQLSRNNYCFKHTNAPIGDDLLAPFVDLAQEGKKHGIEFVTLDLCGSFDRLDAIIFSDFPQRGDPIVETALASRAKKYLITYEPPVVLEPNWDPENHLLFDRVLTWNDDLIGTDPRFVKINYAARLPQEIPTNPRSRLACMISSNKQSAHALELYSKRVQAISWFERFHPNKFDLYGPGWEGRASHWGTIRSKHECLSQHRFSICYENACGLPGYITEKLFDCLFAGCVPIYWGAPNIDQHIPFHCYIDARAFSTYETLFWFIDSMPEEDRLEFVNAGEQFLKSLRGEAFSTETFARTIISTLIRDCAR